MKKFSLLKKTALLLTVFFLFISCNSTKTSGELILPVEPNLVYGQMENGMSYYALSNNEPQNRISLKLVVKAGSCMEDADQSGVAHFIEHLCFNGTEHFEKNSLIDYAESIGMGFGPEVNAYTSFEETVFEFEVPADNPEYFKTALLILHDWACAVTFEPEEIDKERGVILEEWRSRQGLNSRRTDVILPFELKDSQFVGHLPIGDMNVIQNISYERIIDFYKKWYRPELMSVVVVGTGDAKKFETEIKNAMESIPASETKISTHPFNIPPRTQKDILIFQDDEMPYTQMFISMQDEAFVPRTTEQGLSRNNQIDILCRIFNQRMSEITLKTDSPWLEAGMTHFIETNFSAFTSIYCVPKEGMVVQAMQTLLDEYDRLKIHGINASEFKRVKAGILSEEEQRHNQKDGISSGTKASEICTQILTGKTYISDEYYYQLECKYLKSITIEEVNQLFNELLPDRGTMLQIDSKTTEVLPSRNELMEIWTNYQSESEIQNYEDSNLEGSLMTRPNKKADVIEVSKIPELNATAYTFANGAKVIFRKSDFDKDLVYMKAISKGGLALESDDKWISGVYSPFYAIYSGVCGLTISDLQKYLTDKRLGFSIQLNEHYEAIYANCSLNNTEDMMQVLNRFMSEPQFTEEGWNVVNLNAQQTANNYCLTPDMAFYTKVDTVLYGDDVRHHGIDINAIKSLNREDAQKIYKEHFCNPSDFTFVFTGDFNEKQLLELCAYYIGTIPSSKRADEDLYKPYNFPKNITTQVVQQGLENKGQVFIGFGGNLPAAASVEEAWEQNEMIEQLRALLDIRLREIIREDKGGTYGVEVYSLIDGTDERYYEIKIYFGCEPEREQELTDAVLAVLEELQTKEVSASYIEKLTEAYRRNFEINLRSNSWWADRIIASQVYDCLPLSVVTNSEIIPGKITPESIKLLANKYINIKNFVSVYLQPQK